MPYELRKRLFKEPRNIFLAGIAVAQFIAICYFNLNLQKQHLGTDAASCYRNAVEIWEQGRLILDYWKYSTTLNIDSPVPLASFFYGIFGDIFVSYGCANILFTVLCIAFFWKLMTEFEISELGKLLSLNMFICPHLIVYDSVNSLAYGSILFYDGGFYSGRILTALLVLLSTTIIYKGGIPLKLVWMSVLAAVICGVSSGLWLIGTVLFPLMMWLFFEMSGSDVSFDNVAKSKTLQYLFLLSVVSVAGKMLTSKVFHIKLLDTGMPLVTLDKFWANIQSLFLGFMDIQSALPMSGMVLLFSYQGALYAIYFLFAVLMIFSVVVKYFQCRENACLWQWRMLLVFLLANFFILGLLATNYGSYMVESRYYAIIYVVGLIFLGEFLGRWLVGKRILSVACILLVLALDVSSSRSYIRSCNNFEDLEAIACEIGKYEEHIVCTFGTSLYADYRRLSVYDTDKVYKNVQKLASGEIDKIMLRGFESDRVFRKIWGDFMVAQVADSTNGVDVLEHGGDMILITKVGQTDEMPVHIRKNAHVVHENFHGYTILRYHSSE